MAVICYIKKKSGKYKKIKSRETRNGGKVKYNGKTYDAPRADENEIFELKHWLLGYRQFAFYREGHPTPIPLDKDTEPRTFDNPDDDEEFLAAVIKRALWEAGAMDTKINAALGGQGLLILLLLIHWFW